MTHMTALKGINEEIRKQIAEWEKSNSDCSDYRDSNYTSITKEVYDGGGVDQDSTRCYSTYVLVSRLNESYDTTTTMKNNDGFETT